ncbi:hypothetical protein [Thioclava sp. GXIMD4216]|uniref:hypothetical protein n=1 Tax=Thioclava sp. GXIMD4216 TaxID=3131929 RepID=UPI0030D1DC5B
MRLWFRRPPSIPQPLHVAVDSCPPKPESADSLYKATSDKINCFSDGFTLASKTIAGCGALLTGLSVFLVLQHSHYKQFEFPIPSPSESLALLAAGFFASVVLIFVFLVSMLGMTAICLTISLIYWLWKDRGIRRIKFEHLFLLPTSGYFLFLLGVAGWGNISASISISIYALGAFISAVGFTGLFWEQREYHAKFVLTIVLGFVVFLFSLCFSPSDESSSVRNSLFQGLGFTSKTGDKILINNDVLAQLQAVGAHPPLIDKKNEWAEVEGEILWQLPQGTAVFRYTEKKAEEVGDKIVTKTAEYTLSVPAEAIRKLHVSEQVEETTSPLSSDLCQILHGLRADLEAF